MESNPLVFDISSDDDESTPPWLRVEEPKGDDYDWLSEVLQSVDKVFDDDKGFDDDSDEVVVVGEVNNACKKSKPLKVRKVVAEEDDDECVVLDGDPDKALSDVNDSQEDSDDLLIVGHKGPIACRDFPHPRHDCAKFPFTSTSHEQHCELCHCFVCDIRAPCPHWGSGISKSDHCHATDKEETWKTLRKTCRRGRNVPLAVSKAPVTSQSTAVPQVNQAQRLRLTSRATPVHNIAQPTLQNQVSRPTPARTVMQPTLQNQASWPTAARNFTQPTLQNQVSQPTPPCNITQPTVQNQASWPTPNCLPLNHVPRPPIIRPCSSSTRYSIPYNPSFGSRLVSNKNTMQPRSGPQQFLGVNNTAFRRGQGIKICNNLSSQFAPSNTMPKRPNSGFTSATNQTMYVPTTNGTSALSSEFPQNPAPVTVPNGGNPGGFSNFGSGTNLGTYGHQSCSQPCIDSVSTNSAPTESSVYSQPLPLSNEHPVNNQLHIQNQPATNFGSDSHFNWVNNIGQSNQQSSVECLPLQTLGSTNEGEPLKEEVSLSEKTYINELESLLFENQTVPENPVTPDFNAQSPSDHLSFETGLLFFDIDTSCSWDHLTRA